MKLVVYLQYGKIELNVASLFEGRDKVEQYKKDGLSVTGYEISRR